MSSAKASTEDKGMSLDVITCFSFNADQSQVAVCPNTHEVIIYDTAGAPADTTKWKKLHTVSEHTAVVSGIAWSSDNKILTASHDRNAYVWDYDSASSTWKPTLCVLRINRAATSAVWAPNEKKFAVSSGSKQIAICTHEASSNWWTSKIVRKNHRSTVLTAAFSPNSQLLLTAGTDYKARVVSVFDKTVDTKTGEYDAIFGGNPALYTFGETLLEFDCGSGANGANSSTWVNVAAWAPNGTVIAYAGHGSTVHFVDLAQSTTAVQTITLKGFPFLQLEFLDDTTAVAVGFDKNPAFFTRDAAGQWTFKTFAEKEGAAAGAGAAAPAATATSKAFAMFQQADSKGTKFGADASSGTKASFTTHANTVTCLKLNPKNRYQFATSGLDGKIVQWDAKKCL